MFNNKNFFMMLILLVLSLAACTQPVDPSTSSKSYETKPTEFSKPTMVPNVIQMNTATPPPTPVHTNTATPQPTPTQTNITTFEPTITPNPINNGISDDEQVVYKVIEKEEIIALLNMKKESIVEKFGEDYEYEIDYYEPYVSYHIYKDVGISFLFEFDEDSPYAIILSHKIKYNNVTSGMKFEDIKKELGEIDIIITPLYGSSDNYYILEYEFDEFDILFISVWEDGRDCSMTFYKKVKAVEP